MRRSGDRSARPTPRRSAEPTSTALDALAIDIGVTYERGALAPEAGWPQPAEKSWQPTGRPGARLPHVWLERNGERHSTLDLLGPGLTVFTGSEGEHWQTAARHAAAGVGVDIRVLVVGRHGLCDPADAFEATYGLDPDGAVVVRPDGHIAWRSPLQQRSGCRAGAPVRDRFRARGADGGIRRHGSRVTAPGAWHLP